MQSRAFQKCMLQSTDEEEKEDSTIVVLFPGVGRRGKRGREE